jgi:hypothetical protein
MARLVEDSEDELPEIAVVVNKYGSGAGTKAPSRCGLKNARPRDVLMDQKMMKPMCEKRIDGNESSPESVQDAVVFEKRKARRRILKNISDKPLLRPLDVGERSSTSSSVSRNVRRTRRIVPKNSNPSPGQEVVNESVEKSYVEEEDGSLLGDSTGLSDFIVNDSSSLEEESSEEEPQFRPPRSTRKLVRGVKKTRRESTERKDQACSDVQSQEDQILPSMSKHQRVTSNFRSSSGNLNDYGKDVSAAAVGISKPNRARPVSRGQTASSDIEEPFALLRL